MHWNGRRGTEGLEQVERSSDVPERTALCSGHWQVVGLWWCRLCCCCQCKLGPLLRQEPEIPQHPPPMKPMPHSPTLEAGDCPEAEQWPWERTGGPKKKWCVISLLGSEEL